MTAMQQHHPAPAGETAETGETAATGAIGSPPAAGHWRDRWLDRLRDTAFPTPATAQHARHAPRRTVIGYVAGFVAALVYQLVIPAGRSHLTHIWAEDGTVFLQDGVTGTFPGSIVAPYGGYLHVLPRLTGEAVSHLPIAQWAVGMAVTAAVLRAALALLVFAASVGHLRSLPLRLVIAASTILLPAVNSESLGNITNLHWFVTFAAFWTLLWRPAHRWQIVLITTALALFATTTPLGLTLLPLAVVRLTLPRRRDRLPGIAFIVGFAMNIVPMFAATRPQAQVDLQQVLVSSAVRGPMTTFTGSEWCVTLSAWVMRTTPGFITWPAMLAVAAVLGLAGAAFRRGTAVRRFLVLACLGYGSAIVFANHFLNWSEALKIQPDIDYLTVTRYSTAPALFLITVVVLGLSGTASHRSARILLVAGRVAVAAVIVAGAVVQWTSHEPTVELPGTRWHEIVASRERECAEGRPDVQLPVIPPHWAIHLPCSYVAG